MRTVILLPARNEAANIGKVITEVKQWCNGLEIVVVENDSTDETVAIAKENDVYVYQPKDVQGKGDAIKAFIDFANFHKIDRVVMLDCDSTYPAEFIPTFLAKLNFYDVVSGSRIGWGNKREKGAMPFPNLVANWLLTGLADSLYLTQTNDLCTGMWAFNQRALKTIKITAKGFDLEANLFTEVNRNKLVFGQIPITYRARVGSRPKIRPKDFFKIAWKLVREKWRR